MNKNKLSYREKILLKQEMAEVKRRGHLSLVGISLGMSFLGVLIFYLLHASLWIVLLFLLIVAMSTVAFIVRYNEEFKEFEQLNLDKYGDMNAHERLEK